MIQLQLLGGVGVDGKALAPDAGAAPRRRVLALLALVASAAPYPIGREKLLGFLWPESNSERARASLRQAIFSLRRDLGEELFLTESAGGLQLDSSQVTVDVWDFSAAISRQAFADAVTAYRGPFLEGFSVPGLSEFSAWAEAEREKLQGQYLSALDSLSVQAEQSGRYDEAVDWRRKQAAADPLSSRVTLSLLKALAAAGDRVGALKHAAAHERQIRQHLDAEPDVIVSDFVASLRSDRRPGDTPRSTLVAPSHPSDVPSEVETTSLVSLDDAPSAFVAPTASNVLVASRGLRRRRLLAWVVTGAVLSVVATIAIWRERSRSTAAPSPPVIVLGSGTKVVAGRDPGNRLIICIGPACPEGPLPQDAFVVPKNTAYAQPTAQTDYIAPVADGPSVKAPGYKCCTTAVFENAFTLPPDAITASITISVYADNRASVAINGSDFGAQADSQENFTGNPSTFSAPFVPDKTGTNRLRVTLWDGGGALGLHYMATVTYQVNSAPLLTPPLTRP